MDAILWAIGILAVVVVAFFIWIFIDEYGDVIGTIISWIAFAAFGIWLTSIGGFLGGIGILMLLFSLGGLIWYIKDRSSK